MQFRTVGHGTLEAEEFARLLLAAEVRALVDVRRYPGSRRHPHFSRDALADWLPCRGVSYHHRPSLGGRRRPDTSSINGGLRNLQFRAYADHMATGEFRDSVAELQRLRAGCDDGMVAMMCAESVWWRCHRRLLSDHLVLVERAVVQHLFHDGRSQDHPVTPEACLRGSTVVYPPSADPSPV